MSDLGTAWVKKRPKACPNRCCVLPKRNRCGPSAGSSGRGLYEVGQVLQRVVEVVWPKRWEVEVLAHMGWDRRPVVGERHGCLRRARRIEVIAPYPATEAEFPGLGRFRPGLPRNGPRLVEDPDQVGD